MGEHVAVRTALAVLGAAIATLLCTGGTAAAHYQISDSRWWFGGNTYREGGGGGRIDPVNMFFYPNWPTKESIDDHFNAHIGTPDREPNEWFEDQNLPEGTGPARCKDDQSVPFRRIGPTPEPWESVPTDFHGAMVERGIGRCTNRYHIRFWGDANHERLTNTTHEGNQRWIVAGAHYEEVGTGEGGGPGGVGHAPTLDWDVVEQRVIQFMRPHRFHMRWKCLPNSYGMVQGFRSDGRISRISVAHGRGETTRATPDNGQC